MRLTSMSYKVVIGTSKPSIIINGALTAYSPTLETPRMLICGITLGLEPAFTRSSTLKEGSKACSTVKMFVELNFSSSCRVTIVAAPVKLSRRTRV
ncbi:hypothetical protein D3C81_923450 [compost metagenome]